MRKHLAVAAVAGAFLAPQAKAKSLQCDKAQTRCLTDSTELTIGDQVGIFNDDGELVATGEVKAMKGERRAVLIEKHHGIIHKNYHLALLETNQASDAGGRGYKIVHDPAKLAVGASLGYATVSIGDGSPATEFSAYAAWRKWGGLQLIARGTYLAMEGELTHITDRDMESLPVSVSGMGILGGVGYIMGEGKTVSFPMEAAVGGMQVNALVGGNKALVDQGETNAKVKNGMNLYGRWSLGAMYNVDAWHWRLDFSESLISQALANEIVAGVARDLK